jgi:NitT/TauT family transport system substrate-binding protein
MARFHFSIGLLLLAALPFAASAQDAAPASTNLAPTSLVLLWTPQAQFAGYYVALDKGLYRKHGVDMTILRGGPDRDPLQYVRDGRAEFGVLWLTTALSGIDQGVPLTHVEQIINRSSLALVGWKDRGIKTVKDLDGRRVSLWVQFAPPFQTFFKANDVKPVVIPQNYSINLFLRHGVDACSMMRYNEFHMLYQAGVEPDELTTFFLSDLMGYPLPEDGLYCLDDTWTARPDVCRAVAAASIEGWQYAAAHPDEALDIVMKYVREGHVPTNRSHMQWMLETCLASIFPANAGEWKVGRLDENAYKKTVKMMKQAGLISDAPALKSFTVQEDCTGAP